MTDQMLRDLLEERVADLTAHDLTTGAWRAGRRARRRERIAVVGAVAVVAAAIGSGVAVLGNGAPTAPEPAPAAPSRSVPPAEEPDATYDGVPVFWSPDESQEHDLPRLDSDVLPATIDLESGPLVKAMDHAVAAFAVGDTVHLVDEDGGQLTVDIGRLDDVTKPNGYAYRPVHSHMLSPDGRHLVFPQDGSLEVYSLGHGWDTIDTGDQVTRFVQWAGADVLFLPQTAHGGGEAFHIDGTPAMPDDLLLSPTRFRPAFGTGDAQPYGPTRWTPGGSEAQTWGMGVPIPVEDAGTYQSDPDFIAAEVGGVERVLSVMWTIPRDGRGGRYKECCPVAGWLDDRTLVYESRQTSPLLVAWDVGTRDFRLVTRIEGYYDLASFADLG